jgi:hypothetical protein
MLIPIAPPSRSKSNPAMIRGMNEIELIIEQEMGFTSANHRWIVDPDRSFVALGLKIQRRFAELLQE